MLKCSKLWTGEVSLVKGMIRARGEWAQTGVGIRSSQLALTTLVSFWPFEIERGESREVTLCLTLL